MRGSIFALFGVCFGASVLEMLLPERTGEGIRRALRLLIAFSVLLTLLLPLRQLSDRIPSLTHTDSSAADSAAFEEIFIQTVNLSGEQQLREGISRILAEDYDVPSDEATVTVNFDGDGMLSGIRVRLSGKSLIKDPDELGQALSERFSCPVEVR